ncbi:uncharacterized protein EDB93DRAFT_1107981 [Suillus bovinus]|uniref:uncharacterized protein n=1 Tax=Suillus bovinus TaxID=48563 RepID=UPI001B88646F|nr:uncharacterized protein EDB93DRAFT_1107981 [Suillus bovinus]KAG2132149.1 hypothetical protein EDB93DRAFT_1107981 [Suillus bovinus]
MFVGLGSSWRKSPDADVIPLQYLGVTDTELNNLSLNKLMNYALTNLEDKSKEGGYAVRHSILPVSDFGSGWHGEPDPKLNPLAAAYPILFLYGIRGIEGHREKKIGFDEHVRWALQYYDHRFRIHHSFPFFVFSIAQKREVLKSAWIQM